MKIISNKNILIKLIRKKKNIGFVPTMGGIHLGHISLIKKCILQCNKTVVSIFINKPQFNKVKDYKKYPRTLKRDISLLKKYRVDYLYLPKANQIYPKGYNKKIKINSFGKKLCGKFRPGHFEAVVDVVDRFIKIIKPKKIYFGEKDFQQLKIIENFVRKNYITTKVIACKTIRKNNGMPYSSRNFLLSQKQKFIGSKIYKLLVKQKRNLLNNRISRSFIKKKLFELGASNIDYLEVLNINKLIKPYKKNNKYKVFIAYYLNSTRLIDNI